MQAPPPLRQPGSRAHRDSPVDEVLEEAVERGLEHGLEAAEDEVAARRGVHDECEVVRQEVLGEPVPFDPGEGGETADRAVSVRVDSVRRSPPSG